MHLESKKQEKNDNSNNNNNKTERAKAESLPTLHGFILYSLLAVHMLLPNSFKESYTCQGGWEVKTEQMLRSVPWTGEIHLV